MDFTAITNGLAARYAPAAVSPPSGRANITQSVGQPPNNIPNTPYVIVWPSSGSLTYGPSRRYGEHEFLVTFYYGRSEGDLTREAAALQDWLGVLLDQTHGAMMLGLSPTVLKALPIRWEIGTLEYGGVTYDGITITVHVWTADNVTLVPA